MIRSLLAILLPLTCLGHSWPECWDWQFSDKAAFKDPSRRRWEDKDGTCAGFPRTTRDGGNGMKEINDAPCGDGSGAWQDQTWGNTQNLANPKGKVGEIMCLKWPAKNHQDDPFGNVKSTVDGRTVDSGTVYIRINPQANSRGTHQIFNNNPVGEMSFTNCPYGNNVIPGPTSSSDFKFPGSDLMMCGGCFEVPNLPPGKYDTQWYWVLFGEEDYFGCANLEIEAGSCTDSQKCASNTGGGTPPTQEPASGTYQLANAGNSCPAGSSRIDSAAVCQAAQVQLGGGVYKGTENEATWPKGCYYCNGVNGCADGFWLNTHATGASNGNARPVCLSTGANPTRKPTAQPPTRKPTAFPTAMPLTPPTMGGGSIPFDVTYSLSVTVAREPGTLSGDALQAWLERLRSQLRIPRSAITGVEVSTDTNNRQQTEVTFSTGSTDYTQAMQALILEANPEFTALDIVEVDVPGRVSHASAAEPHFALAFAASISICFLLAKL